MTKQQEHRPPIFEADDHQSGTRTASDPANAPGNIMLLSPADLSVPAGGRAMLGRTNLMALHELLGDRLTHLQPARSSSRPRDAWRGYIDGVDEALIAQVLTILADRCVAQLFVDGSNFGAVVAAVKRRAPQVRIITFFHNVEARFFWGSLRVRRSAKALAVLVANYLAERQAVQYSDVLVTLSERDSAGLRRLYGRAADAIAPIVLEDKAPILPLPRDPTAAPYILFVGGGFYANIAGIRWFAKTVASRIDLPVKVVGRDMDMLVAEFTSIDNVELIGPVDDLALWYAGATLVIAPILDGSGMKTKVAEALMFGKCVVGTSEAFSGYAEDVVAANYCCINADDFVAAITAATTSSARFDSTMRAFFDRDHSPRAARARLAAILGLTTP